jgi:hypothetical protein
VAEALDLPLSRPGGQPPVEATGMPLGRWLVLLAVAVVVLSAGLVWAYARWLAARRAVAVAGVDDGGQLRQETALPGFPVPPSRTGTQGRIDVAPPWRPVRIDLGDTVTARYDATDDRSYQTWLVYDERGGLIGGAGLQAQAIGGIQTLDLWFFERDEESDDPDTPMVTLVAHAAFDDPVFRARLGDRTVVPAAPGQRTVLRTPNLLLEAHVRTAEPEPGSAERSLRAASLSLTPRRATAGGVADNEPPVPLPFRRDE